MDPLSYRLPSSAPSVGSLVKKIVAAYPDLGAHEVIQVVRQATQSRVVSLVDCESSDGFASEVVDEERAMQLAAILVKRLKV
jgi:hypothetical protein